MLKVNQKYKRINQKLKPKKGNQILWKELNDQMKSIILVG
jgi:hypothetical protein